MASLVTVTAEPVDKPRVPIWKRAGYVAMTLARYLLALGMAPYGISKLLDYQFQVSAWSYAQPLGQAKGSTLAWAFLGYSPVFQFLMGVFETVPGLLLLFTRTRRLGALLMLPVLLNVVMVNFFLDLWPNTKLISSVLLALNVFLLVYDFPIYRALLTPLVAPPERIANRRLRILARSAGFTVPVAAIGTFLYFFLYVQLPPIQALTDFIGERQIQRAGTWRIESFRAGGNAIDAVAGSSLYFDFGRRCVLSGRSGEGFGRFRADRSRHTFQIVNIPLGGDRGTIEGSYRVAGERLFLAGQREGAPVSMVLRKNAWGLNQKPE